MRNGPTQRAISQSPASATLEPRKTTEKALVTVIEEAGIGGVSTRRVHELVQAMGLSGISKSQVPKLCTDINERANAFLDRPLDGERPYLWLDATATAIIAATETKMRPVSTQAV